MSLKESIWYFIILFFCIVIVSMFLLMQHIHLLFQIVQIYLILCAILWMLFFRMGGVKRLRQANRERELLRWNQNPIILITIFLAGQTVLAGHFFSQGWLSQPGAIVDLFAALILVMLLFCEVAATVGLIHVLLLSIKPDMTTLQNDANERQ
ncbi:MAG TPA: hypothetical protein VFA41_13125 [Ktedonobacteraceae bacterium]|nr:hypothetical protein [Ktedonobacteraceae bacterium]